MSKPEILSEQEPVGSGLVAFDYIKANDFRTVWVDGAIGGLTPSGLIHCAPYSERSSIPRRQVFAIVDEGNGKGSLGEELVEKRVSRDSIVREMPIDMLLSLQAAETLAKWLTDQIAAAKSLMVEK